MCWFPSFRERNNFLCFSPFTIRPFLPRPITGKMRIYRGLCFFNWEHPGLDCARAWTGTYGWNTRAWLGQTGGKLVVCMITSRGKPWEAPIDPIDGFLEYFSPWNECNEFQGGSVLGSHESGLWGLPRAVPVRLSYILLSFIMWVRLGVAYSHIGCRKGVCRGLFL